MINISVSILASGLLLLGLISMLTPIPGGTIMIATSVTALICSSPRARACLRILRTRSNKFDEAFYWLENKVGKRIDFVGNALIMTRPFLELNLPVETEPVD